MNFRSTNILDNLGYPVHALEILERKRETQLVNSGLGIALSQHQVQVVLFCVTSGVFINCPWLSRTIFATAHVLGAMGVGQKSRDDVDITGKATDTSAIWAPMIVLLQKNSMMSCAGPRTASNESTDG